MREKKASLGMSEENKEQVSKRDATIKCLEELFSKTADGVVVIDQDGKIIFWSRSAEKILEYSQDEMRRKRCYEVFKAWDPTGKVCCFPKCSITTKDELCEPTENFNLKVMTKTNRKIWINVSTILVPYSAQRGKFLVVHLFRRVLAPTEMEGLADKIVSILPTLITRGEDPTKEGGEAVPGLSSTKIGLLTQRETEILILLAQGLVAKEIAVRLGIATATARTHIQRIYEKLEVHSKFEAAIMAFQHDLVKK